MYDLLTIGLVTAAATVAFHVVRSVMRDRRTIREHEFQFQVGDKVVEWRAFAGYWSGFVVAVDPGSERPVLVQFDCDRHHRRPGPVRWVAIETKDQWGRDETWLHLQELWCAACDAAHVPRFPHCLVVRPPPERDAREELLH